MYHLARWCIKLHEVVDKGCDHMGSAYKCKLTFSTSDLFNEDNIPWLLDMLKEDVFGGADRITKADFMQVRGDSEDRNAFWKVVSQIAVEKFNMKEVFNMNSSVRLAAIEKLGKL